MPRQKYAGAFLWTSLCNMLKGGGRANAASILATSGIALLLAEDFVEHLVRLRGSRFLLVRPDDGAAARGA